ncbi:platelet factor 4-like isoform X1 [Marmota flaviventris]
MGLILCSCSLCSQLKPGLLLLGLLLLSAVVTVASGGESRKDGDFHCVCVKTMSKVNAEYIFKLEVIKAGPHCATAQMIATLKSGRKICLERQVSLFKRLMKKLLDS